ncbi:MAG: site-specific integrase, partial [Gemmobacter sp.]|nr:site-specific integrase [Gemmobacter sp.]
MGTIIGRTRKDGTVGYTARVQLKREGKILFTKAQTFDRESAAKAWVTKKEKEIYAPGFLTERKQPVVTLAEAIDRYVEQSRQAMGRTKAQVLEAVKGYEIADMDCTEIRSEDLVSFASELGKGRKPQTVLNYMSHLSAVFTIARSAWGVPVQRDAMKDALEACKRLGLTSKSANRSRRPTLDELKRLYNHFVDRSKRSNALPMHHVMAFAVFST